MTEPEFREGVDGIREALDDARPCPACARGQHAECDAYINEGAFDAAEMVLVRGCSCYNGGPALHDDLRHPVERVEWADLLSAAEAAEVAGVSVPTLRRMCEDGRVRARKIGTEWVVERSSVPLAKAPMEDLRDRLQRAHDELLALAEEALSYAEEYLRD